MPVTSVRVVIRPAARADIDALVDIESVFPGDRLAARSFRRLVGRPTAHIGVAIQDASQDIIGYFALLFRRGSLICRLYSLAVAEGMAGRGVGGALLAAAEQEASGRGATEMRLEMREDNRAAGRLYGSAGFRLLTRLERYYEDGGTALRMAKLLSPGETGHSPFPRGPQGSDRPPQQATG